MSEAHKGRVGMEKDRGKRWRNFTDSRGLTLSISIVLVSCRKSETGNNKWGILEINNPLFKLHGILGSIVKHQCCVQLVLTLLVSG